MKRAPVVDLVTLKAKCEEVGDCWEWQGGFNTGGKGNHTPYVYYLGKVVPARRLALEFHEGRPMGPGEMASMRCSNPLCIKPGHSVRCTRQEHMKYMETTNVYKVRTAKQLMANQNRPTNKLSRMAASDARRDGLTAKQVMDRYGCSKSSAHYMLRGASWPETLARASVFAVGAPTK